MTSYQKTNAVAGSTQEVMKVQYTRPILREVGAPRRLPQWDSLALSIYNGAASDGTL
jgi:hypothetical protein